MPFYPTSCLIECDGCIHNHAGIEPICQACRRMYPGQKEHLNTPDRYKAVKAPEAHHT